ncbi:Eisosome component PIL1-domain-containing protein [Aspergillus ambiguus]|uniref:Eisosome component PIL1/LSP1 family protein n=1 Tax=Aspergillus ambiguus TaxID=176160 RepID=UPI003CCD6A12
MCFVEIDDDGPCIRVTEYRPRPLRISIPGPPRRRCSNSSSSSSSSDTSSTSSTSSTSTSTNSHDTTIIRPPRRRRRRSCDLPCEPPPWTSYTTITRRHTRTREESLIPVRTPRRRRCVDVDVWEREPAYYIENRNLSIRKNPVPSRRRFSIATLRGLQQPGLSKKMNRLIKTENTVISAHEKAGRERVSIASQLSEWGESTDDDAVSDISDKLGVLLAEMGEQEDVYAQNLEDYRTLLKHIRDTESSVQPSRDYRAKVADDIQKQKLKDPNSMKVETLEQELVRAEAQNLVAEAQLTNMTRQKLKEAFDVHLAAVVERGEKQILLARHARRLLNCLDDTPVAPGDARQEYDRAYEAKQVIEEAEKDLLAWQPSLMPIQTSASNVPANTLLPAPARKAGRARTSGAVAPDEDVVSSDESVRDIRGSVTDTQEYEGSVAEPTRDYGGMAGAVPQTDGYAPRAPAPGRFEQVVPDEQRYVGGHVRDTTRAAVIPESVGYNGPVSAGREPVGTGVGATKGIDEFITDESKGVNRTVAVAEDMYGPAGATNGMDASATDARDFTGAATGGAALQGTTVGDTSMNQTVTGAGNAYSSDAYGSTINTAKDLNVPTAQTEGLYEDNRGTVSGMDNAGVSGSMPKTQDYGRSAVGTMTDGIHDASGMTKSTSYETADMKESYTGAQDMSDSFRGARSDVNEYMGESRALDESAQGTAMDGRGQTRNVEESVSQYTDEADGSVTTRTMRETLVTRNRGGLIDGAQDTREKLQSQPQMLGGFGLQTIGVPY